MIILTFPKCQYLAESSPFRCLIENVLILVVCLRDETLEEIDEGFVGQMDPSVFKCYDGLFYILDDHFELAFLLHIRDKVIQGLIIQFCQRIHVDAKD